MLAKHFSAGEILLATEYTSPQLILCFLPAISDPQMAARFAIYPELDIVTVSPLSGFEEGGQEVIIYLAGLTHTDSISCLFGTQRSISSNVRLSIDGKATQIVCISPSAFPEIFISVNDYNYVPTGYFFEYVPAIQVDSISPTIFTNEITSIRLTGRNFLAAGNKCCRFAHFDVPAVILSDSSLTCKMPDTLQQINLNVDYGVSLRVFNCSTSLNRTFNLTRLLVPKELNSWPASGSV
jgi:hypothetical protein